MHGRLASWQATCGVAKLECCCMMMMAATHEAHLTQELSQCRLNQMLPCPPAARTSRRQQAPRRSSAMRLWRAWTAGPLTPSTWRCALAPRSMCIARSELWGIAGTLSSTLHALSVMSATAFECQPHLIVRFLAMQLVTEIA